MNPYVSQWLGVRMGAIRELMSKQAVKRIVAASSKVDRVEDLPDYKLIVLAYEIASKKQES